MLETKQFPARAAQALDGFRRMIEELREKFESQAPLHALIAEVLERTGYRAMLKEDRTPGAEGRLENIDELLNAAAEAHERGEDLAAFLDHAALVADADQVKENSPVSLLTVHNAKGLEFPVVFLSGLEEGLFPHSRSLENDRMMEEERRLCYVGMTRAEKRLYLTHALMRRRYGGGPSEPAEPSRFLEEVPEALCEFDGVKRDEGEDELFQDPGEVDLYAERGYVRDTVRHTAEQIRSRGAAKPPPGAQYPPRGETKPRQPYPGKAYNSVENIADFFRERGIPARPQTPAKPQPPPPVAAAPERPPVRPAGPVPVGPPKKKKIGEGATIHHPKYGRGVVLRKEGEGGDAKLTVSFAGHGLKKIIAKYAGIDIDE
jgi:DNA helicase-2/ATP-dependent DNA helicase PcrA